MIGRDDMRRNDPGRGVLRRLAQGSRYEEAYNPLEEEFALAAAMIEARARAGLTQQQLAECTHATQAVIGRLESGRVKPSTRTLERLAAATGLRGCGFRSSRLRRANRWLG
jgi:ribosome-binding protein aMBF1 (putative translation factor)